MFGNFVLAVQPRSILVACVDICTCDSDCCICRKPSLVSASLLADLNMAPSVAR